MNNSSKDVCIVGGGMGSLSAAIYLNKKGFHVVLVSSGAIAQGMKIWKLDSKPKSIDFLQALSAAGQIGLINSYQKELKRFDLITAQVLLSHSDFKVKKRSENAKKSISNLINLGAIPIINENDVVSTEEIKFGDNDNLASMIANLVDADLLIILTDQKGMYDKNPDSYKDAKLINRIDIEDLKNFDSDFSTQSEIGTGGFITKIQAAKRAALSNTYTVIANGLEKNILDNIFVNDNTGTLFIPSEKKISAKIMVDGSIKHAQTEGSIHKVAATILGAESCNGWTYWHCELGNTFVPIDNLRQKFLSKNYL